MKGVSERKKKLALSKKHVPNTDCSCGIQTYRERNWSWDLLVLALLLSLHHGTVHIGGWMRDVLKEEVRDRGKSGRWKEKFGKRNRRYLRGGGQKKAGGQMFDVVRKSEGPRQDKGVANSAFDLSLKQNKGSTILDFE
jgi:hypothetical protein